MTESVNGDLGTSRQQAIDALCEHFASDRLSVEEFERRLDSAHRAESADDLRKLLVDLPSADLPVPKDRPSLPTVDQAKASVPASRVKERGYLLAALGGVDRKGRWIPAKTTYAAALMGGIALDYREALLPPGVTEVWIFTLMGGAEIVVPPGLCVESDGIAILGSFEHREEAPLTQDPDAPVLRLRGLSVLGGVEVNIRYPGESSRDAKRRRRHERRERRRLRGGS